jgi:hypothetical protein
VSIGGVVYSNTLRSDYLHYLAWWAAECSGISAFAAAIRRSAARMSGQTSSASSVEEVGDTSVGAGPVVAMGPLMYTQAVAAATDHCGGRRLV